MPQILEILKEDNAVAAAQGALDQKVHCGKSTLGDIEKNTEHAAKDIHKAAGKPSFLEKIAKSTMETCTGAVQRVKKATIG